MSDRMPWLGLGPRAIRKIDDPWLHGEVETAYLEARWYAQGRLDGSGQPTTHWRWVEQFAERKAFLRYRNAKANGRMYEPGSMHTAWEIFFAKKMEQEEEKLDA